MIRKLAERETAATLRARIESMDPRPRCEHCMHPITPEGRCSVCLRRWEG